MRKFFISTLAIAAWHSPVHAADYAVRAVEYPVRLPPRVQLPVTADYNWTGGYGGIAAGGNFIQSHHDYEAPTHYPAPVAATTTTTAPSAGSSNLNCLITPNLATCTNNSGAMLTQQGAANLYVQTVLNSPQYNTFSITDSMTAYIQTRQKETGSTSISSTAGYVGGFVGANYQYNSIVVGVDGDFGGILGSGKSRVVNGSLGDPYVIALRSTWEVLLRGRIGYAYDRLLPYVAGGAVFQNIGAHVFNHTSADFPTLDKNAGRSGWTVGVGMDYALSDHIFARLEYRYVTLTRTNYGSQFVSDRVSFSTNAVIAGLAFKFMPPDAPVVRAVPIATKF